PPVLSSTRTSSASGKALLKSVSRRSTDTPPMLAAAHRLQPVPELGLFPLGVVLLPTERVPLHIFEPRYKELIGECLESEGEFGLVLADDDGLREVGTRAAVTDVLHRFPDGRMNVVVEGGEGVRLRRL